MEDIRTSQSLELQTIVTGMHLSPEFGLTYSEIESDGIIIDRRVEMLMSSDTSVGVSKSIGLGVIGFADALQQLSPDLMLIVGDRFETFAAAIAGSIARIPIGHIHGGELTEGNFDDMIRHAMTKMSHLHFTATADYRNRVIQLGEQPNRVFHVGGCGVDNIHRVALLSKAELESSLEFNLTSSTLLVTFHPVTLEERTAGSQFQCLLDVLVKYKNINIIFTKTNADSDGRVINKMIDEYVAQKPKTTKSFTSMGQVVYLSLLQYVRGVVGNSSSGILEAPSFKIGTVNIGDRQRGRIKAPSVIDCEPTREGIQLAVEKLLSDEFLSFVKSVNNPYEKKGTIRNIVSILEGVSLDDIQKKVFFDLDLSH